MRFGRHSFVAAALAGILALVAALPAAAGPEQPEGPVPPQAGNGPADSSAADSEAADTEAADTEIALTEAIDVEVGEYHSCAIVRPNRQVRCWGWNGEGELGVGDFVEQYNTAQAVRNASNTANLTGVRQLALGDYHTCALLANSQVRCWGDNEDGALGNGDAPNDQNLPVPVRNAGDTANLSGVRSIAAEADGMCALLANRQVRCWGEDEYGQLGNGAPAASSDLPVAVLNVAGSPGNLRNVAGLGGGYDTNCVWLTNGQARCWGYGSDEGGLGNYRNGTRFRPVVVKNGLGNGPLTGVTQMTHNGYTGCARLTNGQAWCWGEGDEGQLGDGGGLANPRPVRVPGLTGVRSISTGYISVCALLANGQVRCWGDDSSGTNGDGTIASPEDRLRPVAVSKPSGPGNLGRIVDLDLSLAYHACAVRNDGRVLCWGYGTYGHLGNGTDDQPRPVFVQL